MLSVIEIKNLTKKYGKLKAVDSLHLNVEEGEIFGFLGPNGAGKTTTIQTILGLLKPTAGEVYVQGTSVQKHRRRATTGIGYLPEEVTLYENLTGRETLQFFANVRNVPGDEIKSLLEKVDLLQAADKKVGEYSQGMAQRLAIAQSLLGTPPILIWDEPTAGLDPKGVSTIKKIVKNYTKDGKTVFFSSHILPNVQDVADRVGIIVKGKLQAVDSVENLRDRLGLPTKLLLELSGPYTKVEDILRSSDKVKQFSAWGHHVSITCANEDKRDIMELVEQHGVKIVDFSTETGDLEDIFLRYVEEEEKEGEK